MLLEIQNVSVQTQDGTILVQPISLSLQQGKNITILGETGSGKSLLIQAIMGALPEGLTASGQFFVETCKIDFNQQTEIEKLWGKTLVMLPQEPRRSLNPIMAIGKQLWESFHYVAGKPAPQAKTESQAYLAKLGLGESVENYPHQLSGGMAQRASFAIATAAGGKILLADEPTKGLDPTSKGKVIELLKSAYQNGGGLLTITHDIEVAEQLGGYILVMKKGELLEQGEAEALLSNPQHAYTKALIAADPKHWQPLQDLQNLSQKQPLVSVKNLSIARGKKRCSATFPLIYTKAKCLGLSGIVALAKARLPMYFVVCLSRNRARLCGIATAIKTPSAETLPRSAGGLCPEC